MGQAKVRFLISAAYSRLFPSESLPLFRHFPLLPIALALMSGLALGFGVAWPWGWWAVGGGAGLALSRRWAGALLVSVFCLGALGRPHLSRRW